MADLDLSRHSLNLSTSKQKYSFPRTTRFRDKDQALCDSIYDLPTSFSKRATMLGYGNKTLGTEKKEPVPGVGAYNFDSGINPEKNMRRSISFGVSRQNMQQGGPLGNVKKFLEKLPAPGTYQAKNMHDNRAPSMRSRHPDYDFQKFAKNPGPGTYNMEQFGEKNYYINSRFNNPVNRKISQVSRLSPLPGKMPKVGPSDYNPIDDFNSAGRYNLAKHTNTNSCVFPKSDRKGIVEKGIISNPGPGQYKSFSSFS